MPVGLGLKSPDILALQAIPAIMAVLACNAGYLPMKTVTAVEAKNTFGRLLEAARREPVTVTKNNREIAAMFAMEDVRALADALLAEPLKAEVAAGTRNVIDALMAQLEINRRLKSSRAAIDGGQGIVADDAYFERLRARATSRIS